MTLSRLSGLSIRTKIFAVLGAVLVLCWGAAGFMLVRTNSAVSSMSSANSSEALALSAMTLRSNFQVQHQHLKDLFLRGQDPTSYAKYTTEFSQASRQVNAAEAALRSQLSNSAHAKAGLSLLAAFEAGYRTYMQLYPKALAQLHPGSAHYAFYAADAIMKGRDKPEQTALESLATLLSANIGKVNASAKATVATSTILVLGAFVLATIIGLALTVLLAQQIRSGVVAVRDRLSSIRDEGAGRITAALKRLADGDLTDEIEDTLVPMAVERGDELGQIQRLIEDVREHVAGSLAAYNESRQKLQRALTRVAETATTVSSSSQQIASTSDEAGRATGEIAGAVGEIAVGAERQVHAVEQAKRSAESVGAALGEAAEHAQRTAEVARETGEVAREGIHAAEQADDAMRAVQNSAADVRAAIRGLASKSDQIGAIVQTITAIADQTNLLALNAAIEAARAGELGRGFAVVAEEVRTLAEEAQRAAQEIAGLVQEIQQETSRAVVVVEDSTTRSEAGAALVEQTRSTLERIGAAVQDMADRVGHIAEVSQGIASGAESVRREIGEVTAVAEQSSASTEEVSASTQETAASAQQVAASANELSRGAEALAELVSQFKLAR